MRRNRIIYFIFLAAMIAFFVFYNGWFAWFTLLLTILLPLFSIGLSLPFLIGGQVVLRASESLFVGETLEFEATLIGRRRILLSECRLTLSFIDSVSGVTDQRVLMLRNDKPLSLSNELMHAGIYHYRCEKCVVFDLLGLMALNLPEPAPIQVTVYPIVTLPEPVPDLSAVQAARYVPKPGGGFSEFTDIRDYRPGDAMRSVHWKLSAKMEEGLVVREPQERVMQRVFLAVSASDKRDVLDRLLGEALWIGQELRKTDVNYTLLYYTDQLALSLPINAEHSLQDAMKQVLSCKVPEGTSPYADHALPDADLVFFVPQGRGEAEE